MGINFKFKTLLLTKIIIIYVMKMECFYCLKTKIYLKYIFVRVVSKLFFIKVIT